MSLLKRKEMAKRKTELGNKINFVHDAIIKNKLREQIDQASFEKMFKAITSKLDDVALGNLKLPALQRKRSKKGKSPIMVLPEDLPPEYDEDEVPDYALGGEGRTAEILKDLNIADCELSAHYR